MAEKVSLVRGARDEFGVSIPARLLGLARSTWYYWASERQSYEEKYRDLKDPLEAIARTHSEYGYRRTKPELEELTGKQINHKVIRKPHQRWALALLRSIRKPKPSGVRQAIEVAGDLVNLVLLHVVQMGRSVAQAGSRPVVLRPQWGERQPGDGELLRRFKVENHSLLFDARTLQDLLALLKTRIRYYSRERRHSSLGNQAPHTFIRSLTPEG